MLLHAESQEKPPPLASSRHVAWPRIASQHTLTMLEKTSNFWRFPDTSREKWHLLRTSIWPEIWQDHHWNNRNPPFFEQEIHLQFLAYSMTSTGLLYLYLKKTCDLQLVIQLGAQPRESPKWSDLKDLKYWQWVPPNNWRNLNFPNKLKS